ncbi:hypothetical protein BFR38_09635 [Brochothrix thermosphacta]|uniref:DUF3173 domain-containing protein n=1 Tax=Brochothrix thermosphacta TaxID=2756 RepID=UPI00083FCA82|nr:DUF3173 domain-containing protein [Brochothrix thermosphacta]ODJ55090.1 hypothetical protein BFR38_09635 [Brochothrix thermosphacta]ODJ60905.1 hypothetical protein BFR42_10705 [Brochothrix thermosphacta]
MKILTVTKHDLIKQGYGKCSAESIIKQAKAKMVKDGFDYYDNKRLGRVPVTAIEDILGISLPLNQLTGEI